MADILAELEGILGADQVAKLRANPLATRLTRAEDVREFYDGETETPPAKLPKREEPPAPRAATGTGDESLAAIMARLDGLGNIDEKIKTGVEAVVNARGAELRGGAVADSIKITRELTRIDARHRADFNEDVDDTKLEAHIAAAVAAGRPFRTVTDAYEDMTREARIAKQVKSGIETGVREELKTRASGHVPGVTPAAATPMLKILKSSRTTSAGDSGTHLDKAARALEERLGERGESVA